MLNILLHNNKINYIKSKKTKNSLSVLDYGANNYDNLDIAINKSILDLLDKQNKDKEVSVVIDSQLCMFNEVFCEDEDSLEFHNNLSGNNNLINHMDSYYYPIGIRDDHYLGIHIDKSIKKRLLNSIGMLDCSLTSFGVGIFSSEVLARYVFGAKTLDDYLIIRFITSSIIEVLYVEDGLFMFYGKYKLQKGKIKSLKSIGSIDSKTKIDSCLDKIILKQSKTTSIIQKIFIYQSNGQSPIVKEFINNNKKTNIHLLNLFNHTNSSEIEMSIKDSFKYLSYAELGNIFRGMHV